MKFRAGQPACNLPFLLAIPLLAYAGEVNVRPPLLGYMLDSEAGTIRAIDGVPGAAALGEALAGVTGVRRAAIASSLTHAIAEQEGNYALVLIRWTDAVEALPLEGTVAASPVFVLSPQGTAAAVVVPASAESGPRIRVIAGLPLNPRLSFEAEIISEPSSLAVSDDGSLAAICDGSTVVVRERGNERRVFEGDSPAIAFRPAGRDLAVTSAASSTVTLLTAAAVPREIGENRLESPHALAFSGDGRRLVVAQETGSLAMIEIETGETKTIPCDCRPDGLYSLRGGALFRLMDTAKGTIAVLDADNEVPRVVTIAVFASTVSDAGTGEKQ